MNGGALIYPPLDHWLWLVPAFLMPTNTGTFWGAFAWLAVVSVVGGAAFAALARVLAPREFADARTSLGNLSFSRQR